MGKRVNLQELSEFMGVTVQTLIRWQKSEGMPCILAGQRGRGNEYDTETVIGWFVQRELAKKATAQFDLKMRTKAEEDPVVAAASIVARAEFVRQMHALSLKFGDKLQKGASAAVKLQAHEIIRKFGAPALREFAKLHFRTAYEVVSEAGKLDELPLKAPAEKTEWMR